MQTSINPLTIPVFTQTFLSVLFNHFFRLRLGKKDGQKMPGVQSYVIRKDI